ncbi:MAG: NADPH-dependent FMN reductase [Acidobacteria bacterium]|nr:MAG: NADPH-dependent FMN reductase [Acidobacteriota bacterium]
MTKVLIIVASIEKNLELAECFSDVLRARKIKNEILNIVKHDLPLFTPKFNVSEKPACLQGLAKKVLQADAMIFVAPEYNQGIPPVLTNFIAWLSVTNSDDWRRCFNGKPAALATHSGGGGVYVLNGMRLQLSAMGMNLVGRQILTSHHKKLNPESIEEVITQLLRML